jgi:hypothetical protein
MLDEAVFDLARPDAVTGCLENVVSTALVPEVAIRIAPRQIAGTAPVTREFT